MVKNPLCNTGNTSSISGPGRSQMLWCSQACASELLKPACPRAWAPQQEKPPQWDAHTLQWEVAPLIATRESPCTGIKTQCNQVKKKKSSRRSRGEGLNWNKQTKKSGDGGGGD